MSNLLLKGINKIYPNGVHAVIDFNLTINDKEFIVFVGPSGCGKSTTLRMIAGLEDISSGELYIDGQLMNPVAPKDRQIAMVFQNYALYPHMTTYQNMTFALKLRKMSMPVYEKNEAIEPLKKAMDGVYKQIKLIDKAYKKDQNNLEILEARAKLYQEVYRLDDEIKALQKPLIGINHDRIKALENKIKVYHREIKAFERFKKTAKNITLEETKVCDEGIAQRQEQLKGLNQEKEFLLTHETELTKQRFLTKREMDIRVNKTAESIDLVRYLFRKPSALSGGQRQRVALGRCIIRNPKVFLMDEPLSNLDAKLRVQTRAEISRLHDKIGATTIYVTHDQTEAMTMADRIVIMKDGYMQQVGTPDEVYHNPANKFVASFIGSPAMNFLTATVEAEKLQFSGLKKPISLTKQQQKVLKDYQGQEIYIGIRPEDIYEKGDINNQHPSEPIKVDIDFTELLGSEMINYCEFANQNLLYKTKANLKVKATTAVVCFDREKMLFFDKETENRIA